ncbi:calmodulin-A [Eurytemora carolleeae]|uniref:calmodulin-A n=1 Tax=Eurytemora carolleeae TaxID=1294199 RepID=UPI000C75DA61|nr:calmodulin-A [Eurytemora carolleeae]|eukprot:XP_023343408.1 calmodulin-A-like [Eurytemora affinis]
MFGARAIKRRRDKEAELKAAKANGPPPAFERQGPSGVKGGKAKAAKNNGKKGAKQSGKKEIYDLIVNIDLAEWKLSDEQVAEFKEVFMLFDRDEDGVLSFQELQVVMKSLGQRPTEEELLAAVREVSEDYIYDTVEFNEFLQMMAKQQDLTHSADAVAEAFRMFDDDDDDGHLSVTELTEVVTELGESLTKTELNQMLKQAKCLTEPEALDKGDINYQAFAEFLCRDHEAGDGET